MTDAKHGLNCIMIVLRVAVTCLKDARVHARAHIQSSGGIRVKDT